MERNTISIRHVDFEEIEFLEEIHTILSNNYFVGKNLTKTLDKSLIMDALKIYLTIGSKYFFPKKINWFPSFVLRTNVSSVLVSLLQDKIDSILLEYLNEKVTTIAKKQKEEHLKKHFLKHKKNTKIIIESLNK